MIAIRPARPLDAVLLAELRWEFRAARGTTVESRDAFVARCAGWMHKELAAGESWCAWVAEQAETERDAERRIVGQVWLHVIRKVPNPTTELERHAYLSNLYVTPDARGGTGTRLLDAALAHAAAEGVDAIVLWPSPRSRSLYMRHGFTPNGAVLERQSTAG